MPPPPVDSITLSAYPKFGALYNDLCANKVNDDGTSKVDAKTLKEQQAFAEDLRTARVETARRQCVQIGLQRLAHDGGDLPDELLELVAIAAAYIRGDIANEDRDLVEDELEKFKGHHRQIATALGKQLHQDASTLSQVIAPDDPPSISDLPRAIAAIQATINTSSTQLTRKRFELGQSVTALHDLYRQVNEASIRTLEQTIHGSIARGSKAKADYLAVVAEGMSKKLTIQHLQLMQHVYSTEMLEGLKSRSEEVEREIKAVRRQNRVAEEKLEEYRRVRGVEGMVREYAEILGQCDRIEGEMRRLEG